jgi:hypothetical protein
MMLQTPQQELEKALKKNAPRFRLNWQSLLLSSYIDNIIFRHEVGINSFGKLCRRSPILQIHMIMFPISIIPLLLVLLNSWHAVLIISSVMLTLFGVFCWALAFIRIFRSLNREYYNGTLDQLLLTSLTACRVFRWKILRCIGSQHRNQEISPFIYHLYPRVRFHGL